MQYLKSLFTAFRFSLHAPFGVKQPLITSLSLRALMVSCVCAGLAMLVSAPDLYADPGFDKIANNITTSLTKLPTFIAATAYLTGIFFGATGLLKLKSHVEAPANTKLSAALSRFSVGGALLSLPLVYEVMLTAILGQNANTFKDNDRDLGPDFISGVFGDISGYLGNIGLVQDVNTVLTTILDSISNLPHFITAMAYLLAVYMGFIGLLKLKDYIEDPERSPAKEAIIRFFIGGLLFALPWVYTVMANAITGEGSNNVLATLGSVLDMDGFLRSGYSKDRDCTADIMNGALEGAANTVLAPLGKTSNNPFSSDPTLGSSICKLYGNAFVFPSFLGAVSKLIGFYFGFMGLLKLRDHMMDAKSAPLSQAVSRFVAGGAFLSLNTIIMTAQSTVLPGAAQGGLLLSKTVSEYKVKIFEGCDLKTDTFADKMVDKVKELFSNGDSIEAAAGAKGGGKTLYCAVTDVAGPLHTALNFFAFVAGIILLMVGLSRLLKSEQDGPKGPAGLGTLFTFITAGLLLSFNEVARVLTTTLFGSSQTAVKAEWSEANKIMGAAASAEFFAVIAAILKFMIVIGLISLARGLFIIRGVTEGNNQASLMAGMTHIIGGALAINIGPFLEMVQVTLGLDTSSGVGILKFN